MRKVYKYGLYDGKVNKHIYYIKDNVDLKSKNIVVYKKDKGEFVPHKSKYKAPNFDLDLNKANTNHSVIYCLEESDEQVLEFFKRKSRKTIEEYKKRYEKALAIYDEIQIIEKED